MLNELISRVADGNDLTVAEASAAMRRLVSGEATPVQIAALLTALKTKGEAPSEVTGLAQVMRDLAVRVRPRTQVLVDTCGTGGGTVRTFNISTAAAFAAAGAGVVIAKHGNRAMTSACGSADVLEALGVRINLPPEAVARCIDEVGIGFLFAQDHHPAMKHVAPVRRELPFRTVFNCLGPLTNPAGATAQVVGVFERQLVPLLAEALANLGCARALVVHGTDGLDEFSTLGASWIGEVAGGEVAYAEKSVEEFGLKRAAAGQLAPGRTPDENAAIIRGVLAGKKGPRRDIVLLNAAAALYVAGRVQVLQEAIPLVAESIDSGAALARLEALCRVSHGEV